jgi:hypothetical protein
MPQKHDIEDNWLKAINFIPMQGEIIVYDIDSNYTYERFKIGDGIKKINELPFFSETFIDSLKQSDWNQSDETAIDFIKNKPVEATDLEVVDILFSLDMMPTIVDASGAIITDNNNTFLLI